MWVVVSCVGCVFTSYVVTPLVVLSLVKLQEEVEAALQFRGSAMESEGNAGYLLTFVLFYVGCCIMFHHDFSADMTFVIAHELLFTI